MWIIVRFELRRASGYRAALELLGGAGFVAHRRPRPGSAEPLPAAVARDLLQDPAVVSRAVFEALEEAGLAPVGVSAAQADLSRPRAHRALAPG